MSQLCTCLLQHLLVSAISLASLMGHIPTTSASGNSPLKAFEQIRPCPMGFMAELLSKDSRQPIAAREELIVTCATGHCQPENGLATEHQVKTAAKMDHSVALVILGMSYDTRPESAADRKHATRYYERAAQSGNRLAMHYLGLNHLRRTADNTRLQEGISWLTKAARYGHAVSAMLLGQIYAHGRYQTKRNACLAKYWYLQAATNGMPNAKLLATRIQQSENCNVKFAQRFKGPN
ncbi:MAG: tetratricopeptide repeat protein [Filomicrobium sp.]